MCTSHAKLSAGREWIKELPIEEGERDVLAKAIGSHLDSKRAVPILEDVLGPGGNRIRIRTACRWLDNMGFEHGRCAEGVFVDGHEREDVKYWDEFFSHNGKLYAID